MLNTHYMADLYRFQYHDYSLVGFTYNMCVYMH